MTTFTFDQQALEHVLTEKRVLMNDNAFLLHLHFSFQTATKLYLVTDFLSGGDLFFHLSKQPVRRSAPLLDSNT